MPKQQFDPLRGRIFPVFSYYAVPAVFGMVALSSASIIDGFFIGNYVGSRALAAVTLTIPIVSVLIGIALMLSIGGSVRCGKYLGQGDARSASISFSYIMMVIALLSIAATILGTLFIEPLTMILGADQVLAGPVKQYLSMLLLFTIFHLGSIALSYFIRVDGYPMFASIALVGDGVLNIILDYFFVVKLDMGLTGAALATGIAHVMALFFLLLPFVLRKTRLKVVWDKKGWSEVFKSSMNGLSEFANEISVGIVIFLFNWVIMKRMGEDGLAAFAIINYFIFFSFMVCYGISDSIQPIISKNLGALFGKRIISFLLIASSTVMVVGISISLTIFFFSEALVGIFLETENAKVADMTVMYVSYVWPAFLFSGLNIVFSSYLTAMHKAFQSALIALCRSLVLPVVFLLTLPFYLGDMGIFITIPLTEAFSLVFALSLIRGNTPNKLVSAA